MDDKLIINISIAERVYPIGIKRGDSKREELVRKASQSINDSIMAYKKQGFKNKDEQDYLAMTLMTFVVKMMENEAKEDMAPIINEIKKMNFSLEEVLKKE